MSAYLPTSSMSSLSTISVTTLRPSSSATSRSILRPSSARPWKSYGLVRGLNAPPRRNFAPPALTALAASRSCSMLSTEHGPAMTTTSLLPILTPSTSMIVSSGWKWRLTSLYFSVMRTVFSTPSSMLTSRLAIFLRSPMTPMIVQSSPVDRCALRPTCCRRSSTFWIFSFVASGFMTMIIMNSS